MESVHSVSFHSQLSTLNSQLIKMKHIIILGDGMADWPVKSLGDKTLLQYAKTPYMDQLARMGRNGRLITVAEGLH